MTETRGIRRKGDESRRRELVTAASRVIAREGVAAATTRRIAAEAGLPLGTVHYWFAGKDDLLAAVVEAAVEDLHLATLVPTGENPARTRTPREAFRAAWRVVADDDPSHQLSLYELTTVALRTKGMETLAARQYAAYRGVAKEAIRPWAEESGADVPGGLDALAQLIAVVFDGAALAWLADPEGTEPDQIFELLSFLLAKAVPESPS
ncbi:TetR family transcriptional regulator [Actinocorallia sp. API 0066]|uniref:TetR/AcrR family transcriptional regulator n=1 Tax=Actinocorallia sp. API 0066 TaxID=2896846 RepID=UPI001E342AD7|nr:TetR family transcriptional regulator [Actinocorallia sp. API 0066]MCD0453043.1 TetR family transcriptional regulator [Actinocorallia sp. API 0066]